MSRAMYDINSRCTAVCLAGFGWAYVECNTWTHAHYVPSMQFHVPNADSVVRTGVYVSIPSSVELTHSKMLSCNSLPKEWPHTCSSLTYLLVLWQGLLNIHLCEQAQHTRSVT